MMRKICKVTVNKENFHANYGDLLLDSALLNRVELQHECRSGVCGACRVRLIRGQVFGGTEEGSDMINACQARIISDLQLVTEPVPDTVSVPSRVVNLTRLAADVIGVALALPQPLNYLPGQFCRLQFRGFAERCYSPSYPLEGAPNRRLLHFHIRRFPDGAVSAALGREIRVGHRVRVTGPLGTGYFRSDHHGRIVLVASGTGFAPMWSIAAAAITEQPRRELMFVVATRNIQSFYMHAALCRLAQFPNVTIIPIVSEPQSVSPAIRCGRLLDHMPTLVRNDLVYAAGAPMMTQAVARLAKAAGTECYMDPFVSTTASVDPSNLMGRVVGWLDGPRKYKATRGYAKARERASVAN
jgi:3-phenylpropionate/trans-cinnamate dioxygenase ferredoxin reductase subunit